MKEGGLYVLVFESFGLLGRVGSFCCGLGHGDRNVELEFGEERAREIRVLVSTLEDDAVELVVCYRDGEVRFLFLAGREAR